MHMEVQSFPSASDSNMAPHGCGGKYTTTDGLYLKLGYVCVRHGGGFCWLLLPSVYKRPFYLSWVALWIGNAGKHLLSFHNFLRSHEVMETGEAIISYPLLVMQESLSFGKRSPWIKGQRHIAHAW